jgi:hypothetical protein
MSRQLSELTLGIKIFRISQFRADKYLPQIITFILQGSIFGKNEISEHFR